MSQRYARVGSAWLHDAAAGGGGEKIVFQWGGEKGGTSYEQRISESSNIVFTEAIYLADTEDVPRVITERGWAAAAAGGSVVADEAI